MPEEIKVIEYNIPVEERMFQVEFHHYTRTRDRSYIVDGKNIETKDGTFVERIMKKATDSFMIGRKHDDQGEVPLKNVEMIIKKEGTLFTYSVTVGGVPLAQYLQKAHWKFFAWELLINGSNQTIFLHRHTCFLYYRGEKIGKPERVNEDEKLVPFTIGGSSGSIQVQVINGFLTKYMQFDGIQRTELDKWYKKYE